MDESRRLLVASLPLAIPSFVQAMALDSQSSPAGISWLFLGGAVRQKGPLSVQSLRASVLAAAVEPVPLTTHSGEIRRTLAGYRGIKLTELLDQAQIELPDYNSLKRSYIVVRARDNYTVVFSWSELYNTAVGAGVLVLVERDGQALPETEGPLALISRKDLTTGPRYVRWLASIEVQLA